MKRRFQVPAGIHFALLMAAAAIASVSGASADTNAVPLFDSDSVIEIGLAGPFDSIIRDAEERKRQPATLTVGDHELDVKVRIRGNSRVRVCKFPPLRVYFGDDTAGTPCEGLKSLKLGTHCYDSDRGDRYLANEYAAYRSFGVLTPYSYRTRPLRVSYRDTAAEPVAEPVVRYAFFLESRPLLADRIGGERVNVPAIRLGELEQQQAATMFVFQYLIGNTDWSLVTSDNDDKCCHNIDLVSQDGSIYTIPYDFDLSGLVNPPYAKPDPSLGISRVTMRRYRGYCIDGNHLRTALGHVRDQRTAIIDELRQIPIADADQVDKMVKYLEAFFRKAEKDEKMLARFEKRCL